MPRDGETVHEAAERVARNSYGKLVAFLAARTRDVAGATRRSAVSCNSAAPSSRGHLRIDGHRGGGARCGHRY